MVSMWEEPCSPGGKHLSGCDKTVLQLKYAWPFCMLDVFDELF